MADQLFLLLLFLLIAFAIGNPELDEPLQNLLLRNLRCLVTGLFQHRSTSTLNLAGSQRRQNHKAVFTINIIGNGNQARPPNEAMISSTRACWRRGAAVPLRTIDSSKRTDVSRMSLTTM